MLVAASLVAAVSLLVLVAWIVLRARRRAAAPPKPRRAPPPAYPIVLAHGLFGFDEVAVAGKRVEYFRGVPKRLRRMGVEVHVARVAPIGSVEKRAAQLAELDEAVSAAVKALKERGMESPYLKNFVVSRINYLKFVKGDMPPYDDAMEKILASAKKFDAGKIDKDAIAKASGPPEAAEEG